MEKGRFTLMDLIFIILTVVVFAAIGVVAVSALRSM